MLGVTVTVGAATCTTAALGITEAPACGANAVTTNTPVTTAATTASREIRMLRSPPGALCDRSAVETYTDRTTHSVRSPADQAKQARSLNYPPWPGTTR